MLHDSGRIRPRAIGRRESGGCYTACAIAKSGSVRWGLRFASTAVCWVLVCALLLGLAVACGDGSQNADTDAALKIGLLLDFSAGSVEKARDRERAFDLAVKHINAAGGVLGRPVETVSRDSTRDPAVAVEEAQRMIEEDGVHALVGPNSSGNSLPVVEQVAGPAGIPVISPSATSPLLTKARQIETSSSVPLCPTACRGLCWRR